MNETLSFFLFFYSLITCIVLAAFVRKNQKNRRIIFKRSRNNRSIILSVWLFLSLALFHATLPSILSFFLFLPSSLFFEKYTGAADLFLIKNYIDMLVAGCDGVLRAIDREMLERFDGKHGRFNVRYLAWKRGVSFDRQTRSSQSNVEQESKPV